MDVLGNLCVCVCVVCLCDASLGEVHILFISFFSSVFALLKMKC